MSWTDERIEHLKNLWQEGLTASQIASRLGGVTRNAVIGKNLQAWAVGQGENQILSKKQSKRKLCHLLQRKTRFLKPLRRRYHNTLLHQKQKKFLK